MDSQALLILCYILTVLVPIHGAIWLGRRNEVKKLRNLVRNNFYLKYKKYL